MRARRDADHSERQRKEAADIVTIVTTIDQQGFISSLPHYVVDNTDSIPSLKVEDGELKYIMARVNKLDDAILCVQQTINKMFDYMNGGLSHISRTLADNAHVTHVLSRSAVEPVNRGPTVATGRKPPSLIPGGLRLMPSNTSTSTYVNQQQQQQRSSTTIQSTYVGETQAASTPAVMSSVNNSSISTSTTRSTTSVGGVGDLGGASYQGRRGDCQPSSASSAVDTDDDFTVVENRTTKRRRIRQSPGSHVGSPGRAFIPDKKSPTFAAVAQTAATAIAKKPAPHKQMLIGTLRSPPSATTGANIQASSVQTARKIQAAKPLRGTAVFCVDNVRNDVTVADLEQFVRGMGVRVLKCNETKPRRSYRQKRNNVVPTDHKAFFLSINRLDTKLLLDPKKWPADVSVSAWFFKKKEDGQPTMNPTTDQNDANASQPTAATTADGGGGATATAGSTVTVVSDVAASDNSSTTTPADATAAAAAETATEEPMSLSPIRTDDQELHHTGNSDVFDAASDTLNGDDALNSTYVHVVDLSAVIN